MVEGQLEEHRQWDFNNKEQMYLNDWRKWVLDDQAKAQKIEYPLNFALEKSVDRITVVPLESINELETNVIWRGRLPAKEISLTNTNE